MSALSQALPLALAASIYPPAIVVLLLLLVSDHPRRLTLAYLAGAATLTVGSGLIALAVVDGAGATTSSSRSFSAGVYIALGVVLLAVSVWAWRRRAVVAPAAPADAAEEEPGRIAQWTARATTSEKWALALGLVMFLPSPLYLLAIKTIADSGDSSASNIVAVLICAAGVLLLVEIPVIGLFVRPDGIVAAIHRAQHWASRNSWTIAAVVAGIGAVVAIAKGLDALG